MAKSPSVGDTSQHDLQVIVRQAGVAHDAPLRAGLKRLVAVDRDRSGLACRAFVNVMAAVDPFQDPALLLQRLANGLARYVLHSSSAYPKNNASRTRPVLSGTVRPNPSRTCSRGFTPKACSIEAVKSCGVYGSS